MKFVRFLVVCLAVMVPLCVVTAEEEPPEPKFSEAEIDLAEKVVAALKPEQQLLINNLRYLMRPGYEADVMGDRKFRPCVLPPFETIPAEPMNRLELLRLWAVLQSGMPVTPSMKAHAGRFIDMPVKAEKNNFAWAGVAMAVCLEITRRAELEQTEAAKTKAAEIMDVLMDLRDLTDEKSPLIKGKEIEAGWFAAHLWRTLACRVALELGVKFNERVWESDIRNLAGAHDKDRGWSGNLKEVADVSRDLHANLIALASTALTLDAPEDAVGSGVRRTVDKRLKYISEVLTRLDKEYQFQRTVGGRLLLSMTFKPDWAPERLSADVWRGNKIRHAAAYEPTGAVKDYDVIAEDLGLRDSNFGRYQLVAIETCLSCLGVSGGLLRTGDYALSKMTLPEIGRAMHAYSVLHCHRVPPESDGFGGVVRGTDDAIRMGCEYLAGLQESNGAFPGQCEKYSGNTAICLLALLHGGWKRDSQPIQRGLEWLLKYDPGKVGQGREVAGVAYHNSYSDALVLMFFQKYYESEQRSAGMYIASTPEEFEDARREVWKAIDEKHRKLIDWSVRNLDNAHNDNGWGYYPTHIDVPARMAGNFKGYADNSCSQYAMLGYKAASLLGAKFDTALLIAEAKRLINDYHPAGGAEVEYLHKEEGATTSEKKLTIVPGGWGYSGKGGAMLQLTAAGVSSLVIAKDELKVRGELKDELAAKIGLTIHGAQSWMATSYYKGGEDGNIERMFASSYMDGWSVYYNLYSVERACELASIASLGGEVEWYEIGAEALIKNQQPDGGWTRALANAAANMQPQVVNASMAILFLKRASMPVITDPKRRAQEKPPEPEPEPKNPVTGK